MKHRITLHNDTQEIPLLAEFIDGIVEREGIDFSLSLNLNLAMEEAVVNVMNYAYPEGTVGLIDIDAEIEGDTISFTITDSGTPFDPTKAGDPDITLDAEERSIGGLGIHLVRQLMDSEEYRREDGKNIQIIKKKIK